MMNNRQKIKSTEFISANSLGSTIFKLNTDLLKQQIKKQNKEAKLRSKIKKQNKEARLRSKIKKQN